MGQKIEIFMIVELLSINTFSYIQRLHTQKTVRSVNTILESSENTIVNPDYTIPCDIDEWSCTLTTSLYTKTQFKTWNKLSPTFKQGRHYIGFKPFLDSNMKNFTFDCQAHLKNITMYQYNNYTASYVIFNLISIGKPFKLFINNKPLKKKFC
eukprot:506145_1